MNYTNSDTAILVSVQKIWDYATHNAFTDLIRFHNHWYVAFREADTHQTGLPGTIRLLCSAETITWKPVALFKTQDQDLRDPKLSITPDGKLMLLFVAAYFNEKLGHTVRQTYVSFSHDGLLWSSLEPILAPYEWLWRVTWHRGIAYGAAYKFSDPSNWRHKWLIALYRSYDGLNYEKVTDWEVAGHPNETTIQVAPTGAMMALVRRDADDAHAWIGSSMPPYTYWSWNASKYYFGGPNFVLLPDGTMWAAGRFLVKTPYGLIAKTILSGMNMKALTPRLVLPSHGDTSYPGMVYWDRFLWVSYYSTHEEKTAIYLAKIYIAKSDR